MSLLCIDAGNTRLKWGLRAGGVWLKQGTRLDAVDVRPARMLACNVAGEAARTAIESFAARLGIAVEWLQARAAQCGVINGYDQEELSQILRPYMQSEIRSAPPGEWTASALRLKHKHLHIIEKVSKPTVLGTLIDQTLTSDTTTKDDVLRAVFIGLSAGLLLATGWPPTPRLPSIPTKKMF